MAADGTPSIDNRLFKMSMDALKWTGEFIWLHFEYASHCIGWSPPLGGINPGEPGAPGLTGGFGSLHYNAIMKYRWVHYNAMVCHPTSSPQCDGELNHNAMVEDFTTVRWWNRLLNLPQCDGVYFNNSPQCDGEPPPPLGELTQGSLEHQAWPGVSGHFTTMR
jgi:hypothetical protein